MRNAMNTATQTQATMTSREIADLAELCHDWVKQTIEWLSYIDIIKLPPTVEVKNHRDQTEINYIFVGGHGKVDSVMVIVQLNPEYTDLIMDRGDELETQLLTHHSNTDK